MADRLPASKSHARLVECTCRRYYLVRFNPFRCGLVANDIATSAGSPIITSSEAVPFRLTPNMQHFITKTGVEGIVTAVLTALSKSLTLPEFDLSGTLTIFLRDEVSHMAADGMKKLTRGTGRILAKCIQARSGTRYSERYACIHQCGEVHSACGNYWIPRRKQR